MSHVVNVILTFSIIERARDRMPEVEEFNEGQSKGQWTMAESRGGKALEQNVYVLGASRMIIDDFVAHLRTKVAWMERKNVRCFVCDQWEDAFDDVAQPMEDL